MKNLLFSFAALTFSFFAFSPSALAQKKAKDKILANKIYTVEFTETGTKKPKPINDEISFKTEKLNSKFMTSENGFPAALYTVTADSSSTPPVNSFTSDGKNADGEEIKWEGTVTADDIEGTVKIFKKGKVKKEYSYTGAVKAKPGK